MKEKTKRITRIMSKSVTNKQLILFIALILLLVVVICIWDSKLGINSSSKNVESVVDRKVPSSIMSDQIERTYTFNGVDYAVFQKGDLNIIKPGDSSGILFAKRKEKEWKVYTKIKELSNSSNNPYFLDYQNGRLYALIVDTNGAGSGEGIGKLMSIADNSNSWVLDKCFYYGFPTQYSDNFISDSDDLPSAINKYVESLPQNLKDISSYFSKHCNDFELVQN
jgi:hypothetical protein